MPQNCSVPCCTKKIYEENNVKFCYHKFSKDKDVFKQWVVAIRREIGANFQVSKNWSLPAPFEACGLYPVAYRSQEKFNQGAPMAGSWIKY